MRTIWQTLLILLLANFACGGDEVDQQPGEEVPISGGGAGGRQISSRAISAAPSDLVIGDKTPQSIDFSWTDNAVNELIYEIERCEGADCEEFLPVERSPLAADTVSHSELELTPDTIYKFRLRTTNKNGSSEWLLSENVATFLLPISALTAEAAASTISLTWATTVSPYTHVEIERCEGIDCTDFRSVFNSPFTSTDMTSYTEAGLNPSSSYRFRVRCATTSTSTAWLESDNIATTGNSAPEAPTEFTVNSLTDTAISFSWTDNANNELIYEVQRCTGASCSSFAAATGSPLSEDSLSYTGTDLSPSTDYIYRVRATGATGVSPWLTGAQFKSAPPAPSAMVTGTVTGTSIQISWTDNSADETGFEIERCSGASCTNFAAVADSPLDDDIASHTEILLNGDTVYRFRVRAIRGDIKSQWLTSANITTLVAAASCSSPNTVIIDQGYKTNVAAVGRGLHSDTKVIPGTRQPATAYYDGSATGGAAALKLAWWDGTNFQVENVAGDMRVAAGSATWVRLAFLTNGKPMVFWTTGSTGVKGAMRSAALGTAGTWTATVLDNVTGAATRALEVSVSPLNQVGLIYLTNTSTAGRARFIYCDSNCASIASFTAMSAEADTIEAANVIAAYMETGVAWCKHDASTYYPAVTYPASGAVRYASCLGSLTTCRTAAGWSGQYTSVVTSAGVIAKLYLDETAIGDTPKILARNAGNTMGAATNGTAWADLLKSSNGFFHVVTNLAATTVHYFNSVTTNFATTTWNAAGVVDTVGLPAAGAGSSGADINSTDNQLYVSYGNVAAPFNINLGIVSDITTASNSAAANYFTRIPDLTGNIQLPLATGHTRNVAVAATNAGKPATVYVDYSIGAAAGARLKYAYRDSLLSSGAWQSYHIPNTGSPSFPSLAFDENDLPWISYYDGANFRYYLLTNSQTDGSGVWSFYQFPINAKTASAVLPATDDTAMAMFYSGGVAKPLMLVLNSTAAGGTGVRAALFDKSINAFVSYTTLDALGASFGTKLSADFDTAGNVVVAYYDITATRVEFNYTTTGTSWVGTPPQISTAATGREGLEIRLNPSNAQPGVSYYDRANNTVYYNYCTTDLSSCSSSGNWSSSTVTNTAGVSGIAAANEQLLSTSLTYDASGTPYVLYLAGIAAATPRLGLADDSGGSFATTTIASNPAAAITGASATNFAITGFNAASVRTTQGEFVSAYIGPNNWLYATTCGD